MHRGSKKICLCTDNQKGQHTFAYAQTIKKDNIHCLCTEDRKGYTLLMHRRSKRTTYICLCTCRGSKRTTYICLCTDDRKGQHTLLMHRGSKRVYICLCTDDRKGQHTFAYAQTIEKGNIHLLMHAWKIKKGR